MPTARPTLLNSCAMAATASDARFRMAGTTPARRHTRVVALDDHASDVVRSVASQYVGEAKFLTYHPGTPVTPMKGEDADVLLTSLDGSTVHLRDLLTGADMVVLVAGGYAGAPAARVIGNAAARRGIMTSGLVLGAGPSAAAALAALRPHARVLLRSEGDEDLPDLLSALRA